MVGEGRRGEGGRRKKAWHTAGMAWHGIMRFLREGGREEVSGVWGKRRRGWVGRMVCLPIPHSKPK